MEVPWISKEYEDLCRDLVWILSHTMVYWQEDPEVERPLCRYTEEVVAVHGEATLQMLSDKFMQSVVPSETIAAACALFRLPFVIEHLQPALAEQFTDVSPGMPPFPIQGFHSPGSGG